MIYGDNSALVCFKMTWHVKSKMATKSKMAADYFGLEQTNIFFVSIPTTMQKTRLVASCVAKVICPLLWKNYFKKCFKKYVYDRFDLEFDLQGQGPMS